MHKRSKVINVAVIKVPFLQVHNARRVENENPSCKKQFVEPFILRYTKSLNEFCAI